MDEIKRTRIDECHVCSKSTSFRDVVVCIGCFHDTIQEKNQIIDEMSDTIRRQMVTIMELNEDQYTKNDNL